MNFVPSALGPLILFLVIVISILVLIPIPIWANDALKGKKITLFLIVWNNIASFYVFSGIVQSAFVPFGVILFAMTNVTAIYFALSQFGKNYDELPIVWLILFQSFRLPLEIVLHFWAGSGTVPPTMSWGGQNFDIVTGILALFVLIKPLQTKIFYWVFNVIGFGLLLNVMRVALMSSPLPFSWKLEDSLLLAAYFPYCLILTVCVWSALVGHIILTRRLLNSKF